MEAAFDKAAVEYDSVFTYSKIGSYLRQKVWNYLEKNLHANKKLDVLELNCGTGEDAIYFAKNGNTVLATDISNSMINLAKKKADASYYGSKINFIRLDIAELDPALFNKKFDLVFSNFGGLNCISPEVLGSITGNIRKVLNEDGRFICVVMSKYCLWEILFYLFKTDAGKSFRRIKNNFLEVNLNGSIVKTYYYSPSDIKNLFKKGFQVYKVVPIGFFLPPTYLGNYFGKKEKILSLLNKLENLVERFSFTSRFADHFLIDIKAAK